MKVHRRTLKLALPWRRSFASSARRPEVRDIQELPDRTTPRYLETESNDLLSLKWPSLPQNILLVPKQGVQSVLESMIEFAKHVHTTYKPSIILESETAKTLHTELPFPIYTRRTKDSPSYSAKTDLITTLGGDGTILRASSLFSHSSASPPILSFSLGTLGFLSEWHFSEHKRAIREVYMSGSTSPPAYPLSDPHLSNQLSSTPRGKSLGTRTSRILLRNRLRISLHPSPDLDSSSLSLPIYALNEIILHRGAQPHLTHIDISVGGRHLTSAVADGMIISTPTGSTAYSLSSGGSIIHPLVGSLLLTPICPRSLSFRPLVLPWNSEVVLRLSERNRGREVEVSVDGVRRPNGLGVGTEVKVIGEEVKRSPEGWTGGVPCIMRGGGGREANGDEGWVGGLNGLLKFNYPFGEEL